MKIRGVWVWYKTEFLEFGCFQGVFLSRVFYFDFESLSGLVLISAFWLEFG